MQIVSMDAHLRYTVAVTEDEQGKNRRRVRINHSRGAIRDYLSQFEPGTPVAIEALGSWYWIVDEVEQAGMAPMLVNAGKAKAQLGARNKTDNLDAKGLNLLQRSGTLPTVWIPPSELRDRRELYRTRMYLTRQSTRLKNRILSTLAKYALSDIEVTDRFGRRGREEMAKRIVMLPPNTRIVVNDLLSQLDAHESCIARLESQMQEAHLEDQGVSILDTLPGVGPVLATVIFCEIGDVHRFPSSGHLAAYAGLTPRIHSSGGRTRHLSPSPASNMYLKWAFTEAANIVCLNQSRWPDRHVTRVYKRIRARKGHGPAIGAVARHLAEAAFCMLKRGEAYHEPQPARPRTGKRVPVMS